MAYLTRTKQQPKHAQAGRHLLRNLLANKRLLVVAAALIVFLAMLGDVKAGDILRFDYYAYRIFVVRMRREWLTPIMQSLSELALPVVLASMLLVVEAFAPGRRPGLCAAVNLVLVTLLNQVLKYIVQRPRPDGFRLIAESGYSFPSGHSMVAMGFYGLLAWMVWRYERDAIVKWICVSGFSLLVILIGVSRIYLGVHYASDVLAGFCVSLAWLALYTQVFVPLFLPEKTNLGADETMYLGHPL